MGGDEDHLLPPLPSLSGGSSHARTGVHGAYNHRIPTLKMHPFALTFMHECTTQQYSIAMPCKPFLYFYK